jgi:hypothetical protein
MRKREEGLGHLEIQVDELGKGKRRRRGLYRKREV